MAIKERVYQMAAEQGFNISQNYTHIVLEKDNKIVTKCGFKKAYSYLYTLKRKSQMN